MGLQQKTAALSIIPLTHIPWVKCLLKVRVNFEGFNEMQTQNMVPVCEKCQHETSQ